MNRAISDPPVAVVVGTGFGCRIQVPALRAAGFDVRGIVGTDGARTRDRAALNGIPHAFTDLAEAIAQVGAEAVAIATPPDTHRALVLQAIAAGCHVLCEKPFAMDQGEAREMLTAAESAGIVHVLGNEFRWEAARAMATRVTSGGQIGEPRFATFTQFIHYAGHDAVDLPGWWFDDTSGGGWLGASGSHLVDWIRTWLGEFDGVSAAIASVTGPPGGAEDSFAVRFRLKSGLEGVLQQTAGAYGPFASMVRVAGTEGTVWLDGGELWLADREGARTIPIDHDLVLETPPLESGDPRHGSAEWQMLTAVEFAPYVALCKRWLAAIRGQDAPSPVALPTFADGAANMAILDAIRRSAAEGGAMTRIASN